MTDIREYTDYIEIKIKKKDGLNLETVYDSKFFYSFGIEMFQDPSGIITTDSNFYHFKIKKSSDISFQNFESYLANSMKRPPSVSTFSNSGLDYNSLFNIVNDLTTSLRLFKAKGFRLFEKNKKNVYVINGRFLFISDNLQDTRFHQDDEEENILKLFCEICGKVYVRDEPLFMEIKGTALHKLLHF